ncbi:MAG: hypothetical protein H7840_16685, partial [Alphaproteobacteria bacterium]
FALVSGVHTIRLSINYKATRCSAGIAMSIHNRRFLTDSDGGRIVAFPQVGGLHHGYARLAA